MSRTMVRGVMAGALALAAVGVVSVSQTSATAEAAPNVSPFAGSYAGQFAESPLQFAWTLSITISASGGISGTAVAPILEPGGPVYGRKVIQDASGSVESDGTMRLRLRDGGQRASYTLHASIDASGDLALTSQVGWTSTLTRR